MTKTVLPRRSKRRHKKLTLSWSELYHNRILISRCFKNPIFSTKDNTVKSIFSTKDNTVKSISSTKDNTVKSISSTKDNTVKSIFSVKSNTVKKKTEINDFLVSAYKRYLKITKGNKNLVIDAENFASTNALSSLDIPNEDIIICNDSKKITDTIPPEFMVVLGDIEYRLPGLINHPIQFYYLDFTRQLYSKKHWKYVNGMKKKHSRLLNDHLLTNVLSNMETHNLSEMMLNITFSLRGCPGLSTSFYTKIEYFLKLVDKKIKEYNYTISILKMDWYSLQSESSSVGKDQPMVFFSFFIQKYKNIITPITHLSVPNRETPTGKSIMKLLSRYSKKYGQVAIIS
jgi:hypothetical protein